MRPPPDYAALVNLLPVFRRLPDATGETTLTPEEAAKIRSFGFAAESGRWKCPPLPPELTRDNSLLEPLSAGWDGLTLLRAIPKNESSLARGTVSQQSGEAAVAPQLPVEAIDVCLGQHKVERPVLPYREDPDAKLVKELLSKMRERAQRADRPMRRRRWQQLYWRYPARIFNRAFGIMVRDRRILLEIR
jgi:hypothetical protein